MSRAALLVQDNDVRPLTEADLKVVTTRKPTDAEMNDLLFAWKVCKHVKSNAILYAQDGRSLGVGAGQMSRVDSAKIGAMKAVLPLKGCVAARDAFFPVPRRRRRDRRSRRHRHHSARRLGERPGSHRRRRPPRPRHGVDWRAALPPLNCKNL